MSDRSWRCSACGYDLDGLPRIGSVYTCPECGAAFDATMNEGGRVSRLMIEAGSLPFGLLACAPAVVTFVDGNTEALSTWGEVYIVVAVLAFFWPLAMGAIVPSGNARSHAKSVRIALWINFAMVKLGLFVLLGVLEYAL